MNLFVPVIHSLQYTEETVDLDIVSADESMDHPG